MTIGELLEEIKNSDLPLDTRLAIRVYQDQSCAHWVTYYVDDAGTEKDKDGKTVLVLS